MGKRYGVLVVDDSPICQALICRALEADPELEVVGVCADGFQAVAETKRLKPSIVTMDVEMPGLDGLAAVERIMAEVPTPILVLTGEPRHQTREALGKALELGALALQIKPTLDAPEQWKLAHEVKLLAQVAVIRHVRGRHRPLPPSTAEINPGHPVEMIAIGCSTGGPQVIHRLLSELPADFPVPIAIVQHINPSFADSLTTWLANASKLKVRLAHEGERLGAGDVLIAPPGRHLWISGHGRVTLKELPPRDGHIPSATVLLESAALSYGPSALGVVLTGMGVDGADGLAAIKRHGGRGLAQSKESCVVFGMPQAAIAKGAVDAVVHAEELSRVIIRLAKGMPIDGG